ncbi:hypothetical protein V6N13_139892 [Hibiscus sabdariffa]
MIKHPLLRCLQVSDQKFKFKSGREELGISKNSPPKCIGLTVIEY